MDALRIYYTRHHKANGPFDKYVFKVFYLSTNKMWAFTRIIAKGEWYTWTILAGGLVYFGTNSDFEISSKD